MSISSLCSVLRCWYTLDSYQHTHREIKVTAHPTLTHHLWRKNHLQNVTWLLKGSISSEISGARSIRGEQLLSFCPNLEQRASHQLAAISQMSHSNVKTENTFKCQWLRSLNLKKKLCLRSFEWKFQSWKQAGVCEGERKLTQGAKTHQEPRANAHTETTVQGEACYRSQVCTRQTNKGSCNGSSILPCCTALQCWEPHAFTEGLPGLASFTPSCQAGLAARTQKQRRWPACAQFSKLQWMV